MRKLDMQDVEMIREMVEGMTNQMINKRIVDLYAMIDNKQLDEIGEMIVLDQIDIMEDELVSRGEML